MTDKPKPIYAEDVPYWKTSQTAVETWIERTRKQIASVGGSVQSEAIGSDVRGSAILMQFQISTDTFKLIWPVLPSRDNNGKAAKIQAATALFHDVKAKVVAAKFLGIRTAFINYLLLPDGRTAAEVADAEFLEIVPRLMLKGGH